VQVPANMQGDDFEVNAPTGTTTGAGNGSNLSSGVLLQRGKATVCRVSGGRCETDGLGYCRPGGVRLHHQDILQRCRLRWCCAAAATTQCAVGKYGQSQCLHYRSLRSGPSLLNHRSGLLPSNHKVEGQGEAAKADIHTLLGTPAIHWPHHATSL